MTKCRTLLFSDKSYMTDEKYKAIKIFKTTKVTKARK